MSSTTFTNNYRDHSNETGYQFEFFCDKCGNGHRSSFQASALGDGISPGVVGFIKDHASLRAGLLFALMPLLLGGITAALAMRFTTRIAQSSRMLDRR